MLIPCWLTSLLLPALSLVESRAVLPGFAEGKLQMVDLTHSFDNETIYLPGQLPFRLDITLRGPEFSDAKYWVEYGTIHLAEHGGTHIDAPAHFAEGKWRVHKIPIENLIAPLAVIDMTSRASEDADAQLMPSDIQAWEEKHGRIPDRAIVLLRTGWGRLWHNKTAYLNTPEWGNISLFHFPGFHAEAAMWLVKNRDIVGVGTETPSVDYAQSTDVPVHRILSKENIYNLENVANVDKLPLVGATVIALPMKIRDGSGGPTRIVAVWSEEIGWMSSQQLQVIVLVVVNIALIGLLLRAC